MFHSFHTWFNRYLWPMSSGPLFLFWVGPLLVLLWRVPLVRLWELVQEPFLQQAIQLSLISSTLSTFLAILWGTPAAYWLSLRPGRLASVLETVIELPVVLPPAVVGVALLLTFGRRGFLGSWLAEWEIAIPFTTTAVVLAQLFICAPLYVRSALNGFATLSPELREAAQLDGTNEWQLFRWVAWPLARPFVWSGALLAWARALGEFGATIIFAGNFPGRTQTMPLAIYLGFEQNFDLALTLSTILLGLSVLILLSTRWLFTPHSA